jgi:DNA repair protein RAD7
VEALGDIGLVNMDKICQIISRNRSLDNDTLPLFLQPDLTELRLYDCSRTLPLGVTDTGILTDRLEQIAYITPNLTTLQLSFCGRLDDSTLTILVSRLHNLQHLLLSGPFLITVQCWISNLSALGPRLKTFEISDTARWNAECTKTIVSKCPNVESLALRAMFSLCDESVIPIQRLRNLVSLDLSCPGGVVTDKAIVQILVHAGRKLEKLVLDGCIELGDETFQEIVSSCPALNHLSLALLDRITDEAVVQGFTFWRENKGLLTLNLTRCVGIKDSGVQAILTHSGASLEVLSLNSLDELTQDTFDVFLSGENNVGRELVELDVGFVRCVNDFIVLGLSTGCKSLRTLTVTNRWGALTVGVRE